MGGVKTAVKWIAIFIGGLFALLFVVAAGFGFATEVGVFPATLVQTGDELPPKQYEALREAKILERGETVKFYYSEGILDVTYGGTIMTDKRILGYWTEEEDAPKEVLAYPLDTIDRIVQNMEGDFITDGEYAVAQRGDDENSLLLFLSVEENRHLEMINALEAHIAKNEKRWADAPE